MNDGDGVGNKVDGIHEGILDGENVGALDGSKVEGTFVAKLLSVSLSNSN